MSVDQRDQPIEKTGGRSVHHQVMGQNAGRHGGIGCAKPART